MYNNEFNNDYQADTQKTRTRMLAPDFVNSKL